MEGGFVTARRVSAPEVAEGVGAESGVVVEVCGQEGEEGPSLVVVSGVDGAVDEDLEGVTDYLVEFDGGGASGLVVAGAGGGAEGGGFVGVCDEVCDGLPPCPSSALINPVLGGVCEAVTVFVDGCPRIGNVVSEDFKPSHACVVV